MYKRPALLLIRAIHTRLLCGNIILPISNESALTQPWSLEAVRFGSVACMYCTFNKVSILELFWKSSGKNAALKVFMALYRVLLSDNHLNLGVLFSSSLSSFDMICGQVRNGLLCQLMS